MKTVSSTLQSALRQTAIDFQIRITAGATVITNSRVLLYEVTESGRLGRADVVLILDNSDSSMNGYESGIFKPDAEFLTEDGAGGEWVTRHKWIVIKAEPTAFADKPKALRIEARNYWHKLGRPAITPRIWSNATFTSIAQQIAGDAGITLNAPPASGMWVQKVVNWQAPAGLPLQPIIGALVGDQDNAMARATGKFNANGSWTLAELAASPAAGGQIGSANNPAVFDCEVTYTQPYTHIQVKNTVATEIGYMPELLAGRADRYMIVNAYELPPAATTMRLQHEAIEQREAWISASIKMQPDLRLELFDAIAVHNAAGITAGSTWRVTRIHLRYKPSDIRQPLTFEIEARPAATSNTTTTTTAVISTRPDAEGNTVRENFDTYGGSQFSQSGSGALNWLQVLDYEDTANLSRYIGKIDNTSNAVSGAKALMHDGVNDYIDTFKDFPGNIDLYNDGRFSQTDFFCAYFYSSLLAGEDLSISFVSAAAAPNYWGFQAISPPAGWQPITLKINQATTSFVDLTKWQNITRIEASSGTIPVAGPFYLDDLRIVKADPDDPTTFNDTGRAWDFFGGIWHIYTDVADAPAALGQIDRRTPGTRHAGMLTGNYACANHFATGILFRDVTQRAGLIAFAVDKDNCYELTADPTNNTVKLYRRVAGVNTLLISASVPAITANTRYTLGIERAAGVLKIYFGTGAAFAAQTLIGYVTDATYTAGRIGAVCYGSNVRWFHMRAGSPEHALTAEYSYSTDPAGHAHTASQLPAHSHDMTDLLDGATNWTPQLLFGGANVGMTGTFNGRYLKIGRLVIVTGWIVLTNKGTSTGNATITLPFANGAATLGFFSTWWALATAHVHVMMKTAFNGANAGIHGLTAAGTAPAQLTNAVFNNTSQIGFAGIYFTD